MKNNSKRFEVAGTKIDPAMADVLDACCNALQVDVYHLLQWFCYTVIRAASPMHELDPRIQKLLTMMESDAGWQQAFNIANPNRLKVAQAILILEQEGRKGFGAVMIDRPFFNNATQTECVDTILERVAEVTMHGIYRRLRLMGARKQCNSLSEVLLDMIDNEHDRISNEVFRAELPGMGEHTDNGKPVAYGKKTKAKQYRSPDSTARDQRFHFDDVTPDITDYTTEDWEGCHHQHDPEPPELNDLNDNDYD